MNSTSLTLAAVLSIIPATSSPRLTTLGRSIRRLLKVSNCEVRLAAR